MAKAKTKFVGMSCYAPAVRMMVLVGWAKVNKAGVIEAGNVAYDVIGIVNVMMEKGGSRWISQDVQICCDDDITTLTQAKEEMFLPNSVCNIVSCPWQRHMDEKMLAEDMEVIKGMALQLLNGENGGATETDEEESEMPFGKN